MSNEQTSQRREIYDNLVTDLALKKVQEGNLYVHGLEHMSMAMAAFCDGGYCSFCSDSDLKDYDYRLSFFRRNAE